MSIEAMKQMVAALEDYSQGTITKHNRVGAFRVCCGTPELTMPHASNCKAKQALAAGRQAIAEAEKQEPVAEGWCDGCNPDNCQGCGPAAKTNHEPIFWYRPVGEDGGYEGPIHNGAIEKVRKLSGVWKPLYTSPPQRQPLTDEQIAAMWQQYNPLHGIASFARSIKAAHGIKEKK